MYKEHLKMIKQQRIGIVFILFFIFLIEIFLHLDLYQAKENELKITFIDINNYEKSNTVKKDSLELEFFDPNILDLSDWMSLGFSEKQAKSILKYKNLLGGEFKSKEEIKKCFTISDKKYKEIEPFIAFTEKSKESEEKKDNYKDKIKPFNPNAFNLNDWINLGFSKKQAESILKYKNLLGGEFKSKEEIKKCFTISDQKYKEIESFINIKSTKEVKTEKIKETGAINKKDINSITSKDLVKIIDNSTISNRLISFRNSLGGFVSERQLKDIYGITEDMLLQINDNFFLDKSKVMKINLSNIPESDIQKNPYLRKYKLKIMEIRNNNETPNKEIFINDPNYEIITLYLEQ